MPSPTKRYRKTYLKKHPEKRRAQRQKNYASTGGPKLNRNWKARWTLYEIGVLEQWTDTDRRLHNLIGRSVQAIQAMRHLLKERGVKCTTRIIG